MLNQSVHSIHQNLSKSVMKLEYSLIHVQNTRPLSGYQTDILHLFQQPGVFVTLWALALVDFL